jgi:hypothetical protein
VLAVAFLKAIGELVEALLDRGENSVSVRVESKGFLSFKETD